MNFIIIAMKRLIESGQIYYKRFYEVSSTNSSFTDVCMDVQEKWLKASFESRSQTPHCRKMTHLKNDDFEHEQSEVTRL